MIDVTAGEREASLEKWVQRYVFTFSENMGRPETLLRQRTLEKLQEERLFARPVGVLKTLLPALPRASGLEIGSGTGGFSVAIALEGARMTGIEPNYAGLRAAQQRAARYPDLSAHFVGGVAEALPFADGVFDFVVSAAVLEHVQDIARAVTECYRVLRAGGVIYHEIPNYRFPVEQHYRLFWPPKLAKPVGRLYARLCGRNPKFLDSLNYTTHAVVFSAFAAAGFRDLRDLYLEALVAKFDVPDHFTRPRVRRLGRLLRRVRLHVPAKALVNGLKLSPAIFLVGRKAG